jgi:hypothetical protein
MRSFLRLPMAPTRPMAEPTTAEWACIVVPTTAEWAFIGVPIIVVRPIGMMVPGMPMARGAAQPVGTTAREAREDGGEAPLLGSWIGEYQRFPRWLGFVGWWLRQRNGMAGRHGLMERRFRLLPWGSRSLGFMETVKRTRTAISTT